MQERRELELEYVGPRREMAARIWGALSAGWRKENGWHSGITQTLTR